MFSSQCTEFRCSVFRVQKTEFRYSVFSVQYSGVTPNEIKVLSETTGN
jgi:hypothetical protein